MEGPGDCQLTFRQIIAQVFACALRRHGRKCLTSWTSKWRMLRTLLEASRTTAKASGRRSSRPLPPAIICLNSAVFAASCASDRLAILGSRPLISATLSMYLNRAHQILQGRSLTPVLHRLAPLHMSVPSISQVCPEPHNIQPSIWLGSANAADAVQGMASCTSSFCAHPPF